MAVTTVATALPLALWWLHYLAQHCAMDGIYESFLVSVPLNAPAGIGSPANAIAIK